jgi:hypothetical protein
MVSAINVIPQTTALWTTVMSSRRMEEHAVRVAFETLHTDSMMGATLPLLLGTMFARKVRLI